MWGGLRQVFASCAQTIEVQKPPQAFNRSRPVGFKSWFWGHWEWDLQMAQGSQGPL